MIKDLDRTHTCRYGAPNIHQVDTDIFVKRYFTYCMDCTFCGDKCCEYGVDVDVENVKRIEAHGAELEAFTGIARTNFFAPEIYEDPEYPGGGCVRTQTDDRGCVFRAREGRGCLIHRYAIQKGIDYHELKPMISVLFPLTFDEGLLCPATEIEEESLICYGSGPTLYRAIRDELRYYFGEPLLDELDKLEAAQAS